MENKEQSQSGAMVVMGNSSNWISPTNIEQGLKLAEMMATAKLLPEHLRNDKGSCLLVLEQASRWGMSPFAVAQCTSVVHGRLCFEGKLVAAALSAMKAIDGRLEYEITGEGQDAKVVVTGTPRGTKKPVSVTGTVKQWRTKGQKKDGSACPNAWDSQPEDMLIYRGTRQWARRYAPEAMLGVYTADEMEDGTVIDITPGKDIPIAPVVPVSVTPPVDPTPQTEAAKPPKTTKTTQVHPAIESGKRLYAALPSESKAKVLTRVCGLYNAVDTKSIDPSDLSGFGETCNLLLKRFSETGIEAMFEELAAAEAEKQIQDQGENHE